MHSGDNDAVFAPHDCGQRFRPAHDRFSVVARANKNWIVALDCRRKNNEISGAGVLRSMLLTKTQTETLQSIRFQRANLVRAADRVAQLDQKRRDTAHAATGDPHKMNPVTLACQKSRQIKRQSALARGSGSGPRRRLLRRAAFFRDGLHEWYISPWLWQRARPRPSARGARNSQPSVESAPDPRSTPEFCGRVTRPRPPTL